ncbi:MAG: LysR family transcriptional regulator [Betaproteobacteria bacterium]|nr:LysR family transcriptional regulator [Betaproteobacteria bacterium]
MNHLRHLRYIDEIARCGSIRQAAERLHVAASAVNRRLLDVEEELGTPVFERLPRGMRLTAAGELFIQYVRERGAALDQVRSAIEDLKGLRRGKIRLIASQATAPAFLPAALASFRALHPLVDFEVKIADRRQAIAALRSYESDLALTFGLDADPDIEALASFEQKLMLLMHRDHPLARAGTSVRLRQCVDYPIVLADPDIGGRQLLDRWMARSSLRLAPIIESNSFEFLRGCLLHDQAITFQIALGAVSDGGHLVARDIEDRGFPRGQLVLAHLRERSMPVIATALADHLRALLSQPPQAESGHDATDI